MTEFFLQIIIAIYNSVGFKNLGITIIEIAVLSRVVLYPFIKQQLIYSKKMSDIQPKLNTLKSVHKNDQQAMSKAQMELMKEHGLNPAAGCLPMIVQLILLIGLFGAMNEILTKNLNVNFLWWNMAAKDVFTLPNIKFDFPGVLVITAALTQFIQSKMMMPYSPAVKNEKAIAVKGEEKQDFGSEMMSAQNSMLWIFPLMFLWIGTQWPSGLALYWSVSSIISIYQQYAISGLGGLEEYVVKLRSLSIWPKQ